MDESAAKSVSTAILTLMAAVAVVGSNGLLLSPILGDVSRALNAPIESVAKVMAAYDGGTALSALVLAPLIDRIGARRSLLIGKGPGNTPSSPGRYGRLCPRFF